jgi:hypothetical protein
VRRTPCACLPTNSSTQSPGFAAQWLTSALYEQRRVLKLEGIVILDTTRLQNIWTPFPLHLIHHPLGRLVSGTAGVRLPADSTQAFLTAEDW